MRDIPRTPIAQALALNAEWRRWFTELVAAVNEVSRQGYVAHTASATLTQHDFGKVHVFTMDDPDSFTVQLPSVDSTDLFSWIKFVRIGEGKLLIRAADSDTIEYSSAPGRIWCNERKRLAANIELQLVTETRWAIISGTGIWKTA